MHKSAITLVLTALLAVTTAFTSPSVSGRASSIAQRSAPAESAAFTSTLKEGRNRDVVVVKNALREFANWNDVWDGDYGYGGGGYGMRGGYGGMRGGMRLRRDVPSRDVSSYPVRSGSDVWRDDFMFPMTSYNSGYGYGGMGSRRYARGGYGGYGG
eukprot:g8340.t1.2.5e17418a.1.5e1746ab g8340  g8340.t1 contig29:294575-296731(-)